MQVLLGRLFMVELSMPIAIDRQGQYRENKILMRCEKILNIHLLSEGEIEAFEFQHKHK